MPPFRIAVTPSEGDVFQHRETFDSLLFAEQRLAQAAEEFPESAAVVQELQPLTEDTSEWVEVD